MSQGITIAIDGPAGAGKSVVSKKVAQALNYTLVDTGAIYRSVALLAKEAGIDWQDDAGLQGIVAGLDIYFDFVGEDNHVRLGDRDVSAAIRMPDISQGASLVSAQASVRAGLLDVQRNLAGKGGAVLEGRDIGTVVFPGAEVKIFLIASPEERARRRHEELVGKGQDISFEEVLADQNKRDAQDENRALAPLKAAEDALRLDSTDLSIAQVVAKIVGQAHKVLGL